MNGRRGNIPTVHDLRPSEAVKWRLLGTVCNESFSLAVGPFFYIVSASLAWSLTGKATLLWIALAAVLFCMRLWLVIVFRRDTDRFSRQTWTYFSALGGCSTAILWGLATSFAHGQQLAEIVTAGMQTAFVYNVACRTAGHPKLAGMQLILASSLFLAGYSFRHDLDATIFAVFIALNLLPAFAITRQLYRQLLVSFCANEQRESVLGAIETAHNELEAANARLVAMALTDDLTSIANRRQLDNALDAEWRRARRANGIISLYIADIDFFKQYNDAFGHQAGDACLREVAQALARSLHRPGDIVGRFGGEEFVAILPDTNVAGAGEIAERARAEIEELNLSHSSTDFGRVTISVGVVTLAAQPPARPEDLVRLADEQLYRAKLSGRNRVCVAQPLLTATSDRPFNAGGRYGPAR